MSGQACLQGNPDVTYLCGLARLSRASFYRRAEARAPARADMELRDRIHTIAIEQRCYGYRRMARELGRRGFVAGTRRVLRLMREDNLLCWRKATYVPRTTDSRHAFPIMPNRIRHLVSSGPDQIWVADITYIRLREAFIYLAAVLDAFSRRVVGWAVQDHLRAALALEALDPGLRRGRLWRSPREDRRPTVSSTTPIVASNMPAPTTPDASPPIASRQA
jgi:putative transposase